MPKFQNLPKGMLEQLHSLQQQLVTAQLELEGETVTGTAGDGAVQVTLAGDQRCTRVLVSPRLLEDGDLELLQDLLVLAVNDAIDRSRDLINHRLAPGSPGTSTD